MSNESEGSNNALDKLLEIQNKTDYLLKILEKGDQGGDLVTSEIYLQNLEEKVDFLYRNYENEKKGVGEENQI